MIIDSKGKSINVGQIHFQKRQFFKYKAVDDTSSNSYRKIFVRKDKASGITTSEVRTLFIYKELRGDYTVRCRNIYIHKANGQQVKNEQTQTIVIPFAMQSKIHGIVSMFLASEE